MPFGETITIGRKRFRIWSRDLPDTPPEPFARQGRELLEGCQRIKSPGRGAVADQDNAVREGLGLVRQALSATGMERGRRRTRQDQISTGA